MEAGHAGADGNNGRRWSRVWTDLAGNDKEADTPLIADSRTSAASFACLEALGVAPPPAEGWRPLKQSSSDGRSPTSPTVTKADWLCSAFSSEWIYKRNEDTYFHVPTNTLWEQKEVKCCDPRAPPHTYFRVDAVHLHALSHFAQSIDSALVPLAWKAWVHWVRRKTRRKNAGFVSAMGSSQPGGEDGRDRGVAPIPEEVSSAHRTPGGDAGMPISLLADSANLTADNVRLLSTVAQAGGRSSGTGANGNGHEPSKLATGPFSDSDRETTRRSCCPFMGKWQRGSKGEYIAGGIARSLSGSDGLGSSILPLGGAGGAGRKASATSTHGDSQRGPASAGTSARAPPATARSRQSGMESENSTMPDRSQKAEASKVCDQDDRHARRLEMFLSDVKRNPQRLVSHVERRRADRTYLAYIVA